MMPLFASFSQSPPELGGVPTRFDLKWLAGPLAILLLAAGIAYYFPSLPPTNPPSSALPAQPDLVEENVDVNASKVLALAQCAQTYVCEQVDCLERILTQIDSASRTIEAVLRTPAPKIMRDHLRLAIKRGVTVNLVLDASLNPKFFLEGASIRVKSVSRFVATNFMLIDRDVVAYGTDPLVYAAAPDVINVVCEDPARTPYFKLFDRVWANESSAFSSEETREEVVADSDLLGPSSSAVCDAQACGPDTFVCEGTTKIYTNYFCSGSCVYQVIPLAYSADCGYINPGFGPDGNPLLVLTESDVDNGQVTNEFVEFLALQPLELTGFTLTRNDEILITFAPPFLLNGSARVHTGNGASSLSEVFLDANALLWNIPGTRLTLTNPRGDVVVSHTFEGGE